MTAIQEFGTVSQLAITVLVDNKADLLAEHGFSALLRLDNAATTILWDAGVSATARDRKVCVFWVIPNKLI